MARLLPFVKAKKTTRTVIELQDASGSSLTLPLGVLRDIVTQTPEFGDEARATFNIKSGYIGMDVREPSLRSLVIEEER